MKFARLVGFLHRNSRGGVFLMVAAGVLSGVASAGVLAVIGRALTQVTSHSSALMLAFVALVGAKIITGVLAQFLLVRFSQDTILELSLALCRKILSAPLRLLETKGSARIFATLTDDVASVTWAVQCLPQVAMNGAVVIGCALYLLWLSWSAFIAVLVLTVAGALAYRLLHVRAFKRIHAARQSRSRLFGHFRALTEGVKELLMHRARREEMLHGEIRGAADDYRRHNLAATTRYGLAEAWTQVLFYLLIGLLLFVFPERLRLDAESLTSYAFAMMYVMTPIWSIIGAVPAIARGQAALAEIDELGMSLESVKEAFYSPTDLIPATLDVAPVELRQVIFRYEHDSARDEGFALGPIDLSIRPGELVFIVGGNGSGKSTLMKVLAGLYRPQHGEIRLGDRTITPALEERYRELFAVVFADFYLFEKLLGLDGAAIEPARSYLELLQIDREVTLSERSFSTLDLSQGQRKRLALVTAYLEDRPYYVFDEWAADQDPQYKKIFYSKLLPDLRSRGKGVIVITHDDRYFHLGDRVIWLEDGKIGRPRSTPTGSAHATATAP